MRVLVKILVIGAFVLAARAAMAQPSCSGGPALSGSYSLNVAGANTAGLAKYLNGVLNFDGACGITGSLMIGEPGVPAVFNQSVAGSYTQNADSTIAVSLALPNLSAPETYLVAASQITGDALGEETDPTAVATIALKPQVGGGKRPQGPPPTFNKASLGGSWTAACRATAGFYSDLNVFTADGKGNIINGTDASNNNAQYFNLPYTGSYAVQSNGAVTGTVTVGGSAYGFGGAITNNGNSFDYVYTTPTANPQAFISCAAERIVPPSKNAVCHITYTPSATVQGYFEADVNIANTGSVPLSSWTLTFSFANGQFIVSAWNGNVSQSGANVTITNTPWNGSIPAGGSYTGLGFVATAGSTNATPANFAVNGAPCH